MMLETLMFCKKTVNKELKKGKMWLDVNKLFLNIDKTNFIIFKSPQHSSTKVVNIRIGNLPVKKTCYVTFLGVLLDENLSWKFHLTELSKKLARTCGLLFKVRHFLPVDVLTCLYNSLFSPFLQYGILVWGLTYETLINVGRKDNKMFIGGHRHNGQTNAKGCHFTVGIYFIEEKTLYHGDSLG